jgi:putative membrane protein
MAGEKSNETGRFEVKADAPTHFSWLRTRMSIERTLMSWIRTAAPPKIATYFWMLMLGHVSLLERVARWISEPSA